MERAVALEEAGGPPEVDEDGGPSILYAEHLVAEDPALAAERAEALVHGAREVGDAGLTTPLRVLADARFDLGRLADSLAAALEALDAAVQTGRELAEPLALAAIARVRGAFGDVEEARAMLDESLELALARGRGGRYPRGIRGELEVAVGDWQGAWDALAPALPGIVPLGLYLAEQVVDSIEALSGLGRTAEARACSSRAYGRRRPSTRRRWRSPSRAARTGRWRRPTTISTAPRRPSSTRSPTPRLGRGRSTSGARSSASARCSGGGARKQRRARRCGARRRCSPGSATRRSRAALATKLRRIGGRAAPATGLSATEERIARLVGTGRTNAEVAEELHLSRKTVEWNLSKIYRKLGVRSRAELAARRAQIRESPRL